MEPSRNCSKSLQLGYFVYERRRKQGTDSGKNISNPEAPPKDCNACVLCQIEVPQHIHCGSCKRTYHLKCLALESAPEGDWKCPNCVGCAVAEDDEWEWPLITYKKKLKSKKSSIKN